MSLIRFEHIWTFLHPADSEKQILQGQPGHDKNIQGPNLSGFAIRENTICLLTKSRSINSQSNDPLQRVIVICSVYEVKTYISSSSSPLQTHTVAMPIVLKYGYAVRNIDTLDNSGGVHRPRNP